MVSSGLLKTPFFNTKGIVACLYKWGSMKEYTDCTCSKMYVLI